MKSSYKSIFLFIVCLSLFSCNFKKEKTQYIIGFSQAMTTDNWRKEMNRSMRIETSLQQNIELEIKDAHNNIKRQISQIQYFINQEVDILIVSPIKSAPITPIVERAMNSGIPTIIIDRKIEGSTYTAYLGANNIKIGESAAKYIISHEKEPTRIIEIKGLKGSSPAYERSLGFRNILAPLKKYRLVGTINGDWEKSSIKVELQRLLDSISFPDYIFAHNDRMALGAWEVLESNNLEDSVKIIGVDGLFGPNGGIQFVKDNILQATILYPTGGGEAIKLASQIIKGESVSKNNILNTVVIDSVNVDIMQNQFDKINEQQNDIQKQQTIIENQIETYNSQSDLINLLIFLSILLLGLSIWSAYLVLKIKKSKKWLELNNNKILIQRNQIESFAQKLKISNESKINFFTALSHEFKTPLTLITSSVESITNREKGSHSYEMGLIKNNSQRLLRLINELLDFRKLENNSFKVKPSRTNIFDFLKTIVDDFKFEAVKNSIELDFQSSSTDLDVYLDRSMMEKVFFNLLSNSFKLTPKNGKISIKVKDNNQSNSIDIVIKDSGIGIPDEERDLIFAPFFQASNNSKRSSGIGLYLTKQFIELHHGTISVQSKKGAEFKVRLLKGKQHFKTISPIEGTEIKRKENPTAFPPATVIDLKPTNQTDNLSKPETNFNILIIEDNIDLTQLIRNYLQSYFQIISSDGSDAIEVALDNIPDVIVCDLNLLSENGFELCEKIKGDLRTSHIPVIILTAMSDQSSRVKALKAGADFYITKPFQMEVLKQSIKSVLYNREKLRYYYTNRINEIDDNKLIDSQQGFLNDLNKLIQDNLQDPKFSVEELSDKFNISRVQLYRKVKSLIGISINEYITTQRLVKSKTLLKESKLNISEVAYSVGYSSPGYFSTSFKNKFGVSPKDFRNVKNN